MGWINPAVKSGPTSSNFASGTTNFMIGGAGIAAGQMTISNYNGSPYWLTFTFGAAYDFGVDLKFGACRGTYNTTPKGALYPCK